MSGYNILFIGSKWWGADSRALGSAFRRSGNTLVEVDRLDSFPVRWQGFLLKVVRKLLIPFCTSDFNKRILISARNREFDFVVVCKGSYIFPETLKELKKTGTPLYCFYPDVSFKDHGKDLWNSLPEYDCIFTTKQFHLDQPELRDHVKELQITSHGYDPDVHRPIDVASSSFDSYRCDVSFVGAWSPKKEQTIKCLAEKCSGIEISVAGPSWWRASEPVLSLWQGRELRGDELAIQYASAKINLGILSAAGGGTIVGDQVTTRTWHVPACGGFLLHEHTEELCNYFEPGKEVASYGCLEELADKVNYYLSNDAERLKVIDRAMQRTSSSPYSYDATAQQILTYHAK
ncbi:glycosyltransferase [Akkermansiaceae bacterium]|nr:glycosyltransferase [Akkermansiaceae bacterium]